MPVADLARFLFLPPRRLRLRLRLLLRSSPDSDSSELDVVCASSEAVGFFAGAFLVWPFLATEGTASSLALLAAAFFLAGAAAVTGAD
ncbi:unannotated protein [freshwater metagenome]|uniref:Unannotated protein n=1 Tax=freshwater metagenome TaxID=449393 RepID=A0A6J7TK93_9ZZZZ